MDLIVYSMIMCSSSSADRIRVSEIKIDENVNELIFISIGKGILIAIAREIQWMQPKTKKLGIY